MKSLRHRIGRWLLRDAVRVRVVPDAGGWVEKLRAQLRELDGA